MCVKCYKEKKEEIIILCKLVSVFFLPKSYKIEISMQFVNDEHIYHLH